MDDNAKWVVDKKVERTMEALKKNNMDAYYVKDQNELHNLLKALMSNGETVSFGGSMTLFETETLNWVRNQEFNVLDRYGEGLTPEDIQKIYRDTFSADTYLTSTNAVTEDGQLYNVDGTGNRVAAMIFGPKQVIVLTGTNKIVKDHAEAVERNRRVSAPANVKRLSRNTPCATLGYCTDCNSPDRVCNVFSTISKQAIKNRIKVIFIDGTYGY